MKSFSKIMLVTTLTLLTIALVSAATSFIGKKDTPSVQKNVSYSQSQDKYKARIKQGLGEIKFSSSSSENKISASVKSLSKFMENRSGVNLSPTAQKTLVAQEQEFRLNGSNGISPSELGDLIYETVLERASNWDEAETTSAIESFKGLNDPDLPEGFKKGRSYIRLRANGAGIRTEQFLDFMSALKKGKEEVPESYLSYFKQEVARKTEKSLKFLSDAAPEQFPPSDQNISPFNAMLIAYSVISDDDLTYSMENLNKYMNHIYELSKSKHGKFPNPNRFKAYGPDGYRYSSPTNILLDSKGVNIFLKRLQNKEDK